METYKELRERHQKEIEALPACCLTAKQMEEHPELRNAWNTAKARYWKDAEENDWI